MERTERPRTLCGSVNTAEESLRWATLLHPGYIANKWRWSMDSIASMVASSRTWTSIPTVERIADTISMLARDCEANGLLETGGLRVEKDKDGRAVLLCDPKLY